MENKNISEFKYEDKTFKLIKPSSFVMREAKFLYSKSFTNSLKDGLFTKRKLESILKTGEVDVIEEYNLRRNELLRLYNETKEVADKNTNPDQLESLISLLSIYKDRLVQEDLSMNTLFSNTADQIAEEDRTNYLTSQLICDENGTKIWESLEAFLQDNRYEFVELCKYHVICWSYNMNPESNHINTSEQLLINKVQELRKSTLTPEIENRSDIEIPVKKKTKKQKVTKTEELATP